MVERNHVAAHAGIRSAALFQLGSFRIERFVGRVARLAGQRFQHVLGHIPNLNQLIEFEIWALLFLGGRGCGKTVFLKILLRRRQLLHAFDDTMVIGHHQSLRRNKRRRAPAGDAQRRQAYVVKPGLRGREAILRPHGL